MLSRVTVLYFLLLFSIPSAGLFSQSPLPVSRTSWSATPAGWTDNLGGTYTSTLTCDGNSNRAKFSSTGDYTQVYFSGIPNALSFDLQGNGIDAISSCLVQESADGSTWSTVDNISNISGSCVTYNYILLCNSAYVKWTYTKSSGNLALDNASITSTTITCGSSACPTLTGAILNSCNTSPTACNEGDAEVMFFNMGTYSVTVSSLSSHLLNYYGGASSYTAGTPNNYTGTFSSNSSVTSTLNSSTGCSGNFIDAASAGTIPAGAVVMMVPSTFCPSDYDFSSLCSSFSPIYVLYYATSGTGNWNSSGTLANYQSGSNPKYIIMDFSSVSGSCGNQYYTYDAGSEATGDGAGIAFPSTVSTNSASPTSPNNYTTAGCTLPTVLPVNLLNFKAKRYSASEALLSFSTTREKNTEKFIISKSYDAITYDRIAEIEPHNDNNKHVYTVYDPLVLNQDITTVYYKLVERDYDAKNIYISQTTLSMQPDKDIVVYNSSEGITIVSPVYIDKIELYCMDGKLAYENNIADASELIAKIGLDYLVPGVSVLKITDKNQKVTVKKIVR